MLTSKKKIKIFLATNEMAQHRFLKGQISFPLGLRGEVF
jgi:1-deoxy-D-xylulose 5-phosphate reductoisomerase